MPVTSLRAGHGAVSLGDAVARFLDRYRDEPGTWVTYAETLTHLLAAASGTAFVAEAGPQAYAVVMSRWDDRAPATWNKHLAALRSFAAYAIRQEWITADPARHLERRKITQRGDKAVPLARLEALFTDDQHALRERALWRLLSGIWPPAAGPPPNSRPRAATSTSPPSGITSGSVRRPPPGSPRTATRSPAAAPTDPAATDQFRSSVIVQPRLWPILVSSWRRPAIRSRASGPAIPIVMRSSVAW